MPKNATSVSSWGAVAPLFCCLLLLAAALGYTYFKKDTSTSAGSEFQIQPFTESTEAYSITAEIPLTGSDSVDTMLRAQLNSLFESFAAKARDDAPASPYLLRVGCQMWLTGDSIASFVFEASAYTGGARGNIALLCQSFDMKTQNPLPFSAITSDPQQAAQALSRLLKTHYASLLQEGLTTKPWLEKNLAPEALTCFAFTPEGFRVCLPPASAGPWQLLPDCVTFPYDAVSSWLDPALIARLTEITDT